MKVVTINNWYRTYFIHMHHQSTKLRSMIDKGTNQILNFRNGVQICELKNYEICTDNCECMYISNNYFLVRTHTEVTNAMPTVYTTLEYGYRHKNKGTDHVWYSRDVVCVTEN